MMAVVDCDAFYVACEVLFAPHLRGRPVVVLSSNDGNVVARSREAKALGIAMGEPWFQVRARDPAGRVIARSANFELYGDLSRRVMATIADRCPPIEVYSIDEAFVELAGVDEARHLRVAVRDQCGIPVSIGLAPTKVLAKVALDLAKRAEGVAAVVLGPELEALLDRLPTTEIWGIAERSAARLAGVGIRTARALRDAEDAVIRSLLGVVGLRIAHELRGVPCLPLVLVEAPRQSLVISRTLSQATADWSIIAGIATRFAEQMAAKLRRRGQVAGHLSFFCHTSPFAHEPVVHRGASRALAVPLQTTTELVGIISDLVRQARATGPRFTKVGIQALHLQPADERPTSFLEDPAVRARSERLDAALDRVNQTGRLVVRATTLAAERFLPRATMRSPCYTTRWDDLPVVRTAPC
jgi:DNA polymerase V